MVQTKTKALKRLLDTLYIGRIHRILGPLCSGVGAIFTLHHVRPAGKPAAFCPNRILDISPEFLEQAIRCIRGLGYEIVTLDKVRQKLVAHDYSTKFASITLDDGYIDNYHHAVPIFDRLGVPFTIYIATGMPQGTSVIWWQHLEDVVRVHDRIDLTVGDERFKLKTKSTQEKYLAFETVYWCLRNAPQAVQDSAIQQMLARYELSAADLCRKSAMSWGELKALSENPLATLGVHTVGHRALNKLSDAQVRFEADESRRLIAKKLDTQPTHFCYPYGDARSAAQREFATIRDLGFATATTTRKGVLFPAHKDHLHALPRISLNGDYQRRRYVELFLSGVPFALLNRFRRLDVDA